MAGRGRSPSDRGSRRGRPTRQPTLPTGPVTTASGVAEVVPDPDDPRLLTLYLDGVPSSALHLDHPERLDFEYMQQMAAALDLLPEGPLDAVHLGAAGCAFPRHLDAVRPGSRQIAVDVDGPLLEMVRTWFSLPRSPRLRLRAGDAREVLASLPTASADVVVRDAFAGGTTPPHLATAEFAVEVARVLRPGGMYLANVADRPPLAVTRTEVATVLATPLGAGGTALLAEPGVLRGRRYGNLVLVCLTGRTAPGPDHDAPPGPDLTGLARIGRALPVPVRVLAGEELVAFAGTTRPAHDPG